LDPNVTGANREWWEKRETCLITEFVRKVVAQSILNIAYFPYPCLRYGHDRLELESRDYAFQLVRNAIKRGAFFVYMRKKHRWLRAVKELRGYRRSCQVLNVQNPTITPTNLPDFKKVVASIAAAIGDRS